MPLVSLCVPTYRRAAFIGQTLTSALEQTVDDFEIIVVDDCSPDNTAEIVRSVSDRRMRYMRNPENLGLPKNLNHAMSQAQGEYLVLLEDHDLLEPTYLEKTLKIMEHYPSVGFVATGCIHIDQKDHPQERHVEDLPEFMEGRKLLRRLLRRGGCPFSVTALIRRSATKGVEPLFDARYWWYADQYLWIRLAAKSDFGYIAQPLLKFRTREADHFLANRFWESFLFLDRIHRDNWHLLHARPGLASQWDWLLYEKDKLWTAATMRAGRMLRNEPWTEEDDKSAQAYLSPLARLILNSIGVLPLWVISMVRYLHFIYHHNRTKLDS